VPCDPARRAVEEDKKREAAAEQERRNNPPPAASVELSSSSSSSDDEADQEVGFKEEEKTQKEHDAHSEYGDQAPKEAAKVPLQEAMEARKSDVGAPSEAVEEKKPQFLTVGVTECTHPSADGDP